MDLIVTSVEMRQLETFAVEQGATWQGLMDLAGLKVAEAILASDFALSGQRALILVGPGNNGGDGLVVARHLLDHGWMVECLTWNRPAAGDERLRKPLTQRKGAIIDLIPYAWQTTLQNAISRCAIVVDALLGTGLKRNIEGELVEILERIEASGKPVIAVDIPTGVDSDTGAIKGAALPASLTVTLGNYKYGHFVHPGASMRGELILEDIGLDASKGRETAKGRLLSADLVRDLLPDRPDDSNKGSFGKAFIVAGSVNFIGAAALATQGAMRSGAGLVTLGCPGDLLLILASKLTECTFLPLPSDLGAVGAHAADKLLPELEGYKSLLVGCGLGKDKDTNAFLRSLFSHTESQQARTASRPIGFASSRQAEQPQPESKPKLPALVLDGDALNLLAEWEEWYAAVPEGSVLTPHPGEMARLLGSTVEEVQGNRVELATTSAAKWKQVVVLKGAGTIVASPDGKIFVSPFSNPALATAGTGDVLAGAIAGFIAQGLSAIDAACVGVYIHGLAGEMLREEYGVAGGLAGDLPPLLAKAQRAVREGGGKKGA